MKCQVIQKLLTVNGESDANPEALLDERTYPTEKIIEILRSPTGSGFFSSEVILPDGRTAILVRIRKHQTSQDIDATKSWIEPYLIVLRPNDHRHPVMDRFHQRIRQRSQNGEGWAMGTGGWKQISI